MYTNVHTEPVGANWSSCFEGAFLQQYFDSLSHKIGRSFHDWHFHVLHHNEAVRPLKLSYYGKRHVLIWLSDESSSSGSEAADKFEHVFKSYALPATRPPNVHPFPLFGSAAVLSEPAIPFAQRRNHVFFSGNLNRNRVGLFWRFTIPCLDNVRLPRTGIWMRRFVSMITKVAARFIHPQLAIAGSHIRFNPGFRTGLSEADYARELARTMICLCPPGFITNETIRHFEAMSMGCVVVSQRLPRSIYYEASPIIQLDDWRGILKTLHNLLKDMEHLQTTSEATRMWWRERCSPAAAAAQTADILGASR